MKLILFNLYFQFIITISYIRSFLTLWYRTTPHHTNITQSSAGLSYRMESPYNGVTDFVIVLRSQEDPARSLTIGIIGCDDDLEIGYALGRPYWGHGDMTEAMAIRLRHLWSKDI